MRIFHTKNDFTGILLQTINRWGVPQSSVADGILSSVNPLLTGALENAVRDLFLFRPKIVTPAMKMRLDLSPYDADLIGSDRIAVCEAAVANDQAPLIVFDFGTATTVNVVGEQSRFLGGAILPGLTMGVDALSRNTAMLPLIELSQQTPLIGKNTRECIVSGALFGGAAMLDGMAARVEKSLGQSVTVIVTGGNAAYIAPICERQICFAPDLLVEGLYCLYHENS
ncbi:MAG: type III pantothenate kinase [Clostridiales bacterium]|nr:type III pantothenate kinase [Clostridiales bacterium]